MQKKDSLVEKEPVLKSGFFHRIRKGLLRMKEDESGAGAIEVLLILVVLIALVIIFKDQILALADLIFGDMFSKAESVF